MNVTLTPHGIELLQAAHERHHLSPAEIVELALAGRFGPEPEQPMSRMRSPEEIRAWLDELASLSDKIPAMPDQTFSREMIYQGHD